MEWMGLGYEERPDGSLAAWDRVGAVLAAQGPQGWQASDINHGWDCSFNYTSTLSQENPGAGRELGVW